MYARNCVPFCAYNVFLSLPAIQAKLKQHERSTAVYMHVHATPYAIAVPPRPSSLCLGP